jgi:chloramphenicol-sensitive protein RarD
MTAHSSDRPSGLLHAIGAYLVWGLIPIYFKLRHTVPASEIVGWWLIFTLPVSLIIVGMRRQGRELAAALGKPRVLLLLFAGALLIGSNWLIYVYAINSGHIFATSLGYYINPLMNVLAGTLFLGERLTPRQWIAVALAGAGVALLAADALDMLGIALALAVTFSGYGLVRRAVPVGAVPALAVETGLLILPAIGLLVWHDQGPGLSFGREITTDLLLVASGLITAIPLLMFAVAARRMDYSTLGFVQYLSPTMIFILGLFVFHEPLREIQLACFVIIWAAIALFVWDIVARHRRA